MAIDLSTLDAREALTAIYIGYYDRAADPAGLAFWEDVVGQDGFNLVSITTLFAAASETNDLFPFFADPASTTPTAFLTQLYLNLFNREPDPAGLAYWANELSAAVNGERADDDPNPGNPVLTVGQIITSIIEGAQAPDDEVITNKITAALDWTATAETVSDFEYNDAAAQSAAAVIDGVDETQASVAAAAATTDSFFEPLLNPSVPGDEIDLEIGVTRVSGTENDDQFNAFVGQNASGGVANTLSSASNLDGKGGNDRLHAELAPEFLGTSGAGGSQNATDIQPTLKNIEEIDLEARDRGNNNDNNITVDAKNITDHVEIGSYFSDGDLKIENLTTLRSDGSARNTDAITVTMDHTDNFNSDNDASDLTVLFDNDYLLAGEASEFTIQLRIVNTLELARNDDPLNSFKSITFTVGETEVMVDIEGLATYAEVRDAINAELDAQGITGVIADVDLARTAIFTDDIEEFDQGDLAGSYLPVNIVSTNQELATGPIELISDIEDFNGLNTWVDGGQIDTQDPISVSIDLHKAGRGGEGGDIIIGGKADNVNEGIAGGIEVFNIDVLGIGGDGAAAKPSNVGTITSTLDSLRVVNINTAAEFRNGDSFASLVVRNGFNNNLDEIDADGFLGNLTLGDGNPIENGTNDDGVITNAKTVSAMGGGDITINAVINESNAAFEYDTGEGDDEINITLDGDALDYAGSGLDVQTGGGDDMVTVDGTAIQGVDGNERLNQAILKNVNIETGSGDDTIVTTVGSRGDLNIDAGTGNDFINTSGGDDDGTPDTALWAFNYDDARIAANGGDLDTPVALDDLPGVPTSLAYLGGATVTVTLSGAGTGTIVSGGGVMSLLAPGAVQGDDGYEASATIGNLKSGNQYYGDQRDINEAIKNAIENDPVLSKLLTVEFTANNTLLIESTTGGDFDPDDLRIDIAQLGASSTTYANAVLAEARAVFSNSALVVTDLFAAGDLDTAPANAYLDGGPGAAIATSAGANDYYDGLSVNGDVNSVLTGPTDENNQVNDGDNSVRETDNVITPGEGDDLVVLSTDATGPTIDAFTPINGNTGFNTLQNLASNETIVLEGPGFGDDTIMNFTTGARVTTETPVNQGPVTVQILTQGTDEVAEESTVVPEIFTLEVSAPETGEAGDINYGDQTATIVDTMSLADVVQEFIDQGDVTFGAVTYTPTAGTTPGTVVFTETTPAGGDQTNIGVADFTPAVPAVGGVLVAVANTQDGDTVVTTPGVALATESFTVTFGNSLIDTTYTFDGETIPVLEGQTGVNIAAAAANGIYDNYTVDSVAGNVVTFSAITSGDVDDVEDSDFVGANVVVNTINTNALQPGVDFLDFTDYLTSQFDSSSGPGPDSSASNILIPVTLDYSQSNTLGGTGDGSADADVEANEVAAVRMAGDAADSETFGTLTATAVANLFNNDGTFTGFGGDSSFGDMNASNFDVETYSKVDQEELIGNAKAVFMVENAANLGEYKVFELTWSGDETEDNGDSVSVVALGSLDFGTSLTDFDDVNLVGSDDYANLINNGFGAA